MSCFECGTNWVFKYYLSNFSIQMVNVKFQLFQPNYLDIKLPPRTLPWLWPHTLYHRKITYGLYCIVSWRTEANDSVKIPRHSADTSKVHEEYKSQMWHLTADNLNIAVFTDVTLYSSVNRYQQFREVCFLQYKCRTQFSAPQVEAGGSSKLWCIHLTLHKLTYL